MTEQCFIGIDPGKTGAVSVFCNNKFLTVFDMPVFVKKNKKYIDAPKLYELLSQYNIVKASLEDVHAYPKKNQGVVSSFDFGRSFGVIIGVLAGLEVSVNFVSPQKWKSKFYLVGTKKDAARLLVIKMFPEQSSYFKLKKHIDRADATLIGMM